MGESAQRVNAGSNQPASGILGEELARAMHAVFKNYTQAVNSVQCSKIAPTSLPEALESIGGAVSALEVQFHEGAEGAILLLVPTPELMNLGELIAGFEATTADPLPPELTEACLQYLKGVLDELKRNLFEGYGKRLDCGVPELINPDGHSLSLQPLGGMYEGSVGLTLKVASSSKFNCTLKVLAQAGFISSLNASLVPSPAGADKTQSRRPRTGSTSAAMEENDTVMDNRELSSFRASERDTPGNGNWNMDLILDVDLPIIVSFGVTEMQLRDVLKLGVGSVIELNKAVNDPVTLIVNQKAIARGEVVMVEGNYGVRILEVESAKERIRSLA